MCGGAECQARLLGLQCGDSEQALWGFELEDVRAGDCRKGVRQAGGEGEVRILWIRVLESDWEEVASGDPLGRFLLPLRPLLIGRICVWAERKESGFGHDCLLLFRLYSAQQ